jgi:hypothetical protein
MIYAAGAARPKSETTTMFEINGQMSKLTEHAAG